MTRALLVCAALALIIVLCGAIYAAVSSWREHRLHPAPGRLVDIAGREAHVHCLGTGGPTVILEAGAGGTVLDWNPLQHELAKTTTVCAYDRAGLGWSEAGEKPRTVQKLSREARALFAAAELRPPFVLVGHSFGGLVALQTAILAPVEVAGVVLVDSVHPDIKARIPEPYADIADSQLRMLRLGSALAFTGLPRLLFPPLAPRGLPPEADAPAKARGYRGDAYRTVLQEAVAFDQSVADLDIGPFPAQVPLLVISRGKTEAWPPSIDSEVAEQAWRQMQLELAGLSTQSRHLTVEDAGHFPHIEQPAIVASAILDLIRGLDQP